MFNSSYSSRIHEMISKLLNQITFLNSSYPKGRPWRKKIEKANHFVGDEDKNEALSGQ